MKILYLFFVLLLSLPAFAIPRQVRDTTAPYWKAQPPFYVPLGSANVALRKPVTSSDDTPILGDLKLITDGRKECTENGWVELGPGTQWVQIDLLKPQRIFGVQIWHYFGDIRVYRDVIVQLSNDREFKTGVQTIYNNDHNDTSGLGKGTDREYYEANTGYRIETLGKNYEGKIARYVRLYSKGNTSDPVNQYIEVEVIGRAPDAPPTKPVLPPLDLSNYWSLTNSAAYLKRWPNEDENLPPLRFDFFQAPDIAYQQLVPLRQAAPDARQLQKTRPLSAELRKAGIQLLPATSWKQCDLGREWRLFGLSFSGFYPNGPLARDCIIVTASDGDFTKNVRVLFDSTKEKLQRFSEDKNAQRLLIDTRGPKYQGITARFVRVYSRRADLAGNGLTILGAPVTIAQRDDLMLWKTDYPPVPYT